ncbi:MAG: ATP-binding protein [Flavobacterium sp.]|nr:ATP-binding protein [Flavobacterium sp.]
MRLFIYTCLFFIIASSVAAQESTLIVSNTMYDNEKGFCKISEKDGWLFKAGNVSNATNVDLDTKTWTKFKPADLSGENLDKNGRFEGWFRIKVQFKNTPDFTPPGITSYTWNASEVFANGKKIAAFGQLGNDLSFEDNKPARQFPIQTNFQPNTTYVIAVHVVAYADPFAITTKLKGGDKNVSILLLTNKVTSNYFVAFWPMHTFYDGLLSAVSATLSLLFWILFGLNRNEKNIKRFAIGCTFLTILSISVAFLNVVIGYTSYMIINSLTAIAVVSYVFYIPFILAGVFNRSISRSVKIFMIIPYLIVLVTAVLQSGGWILLFAIVPLIIAFYYLVASWKGLKGAQWAIVTGFLLSFIFLIVLVWAGDSTYRMVFILVYTIAPPLGMLIYVAFRFGEMIYEVQAKAAEVLHLSEEKREQAMSQQKVLEAEVEKQTAELRTTLTNLKATQSQLIQSEKMASLGELTAGIAHEIQNPLNFVNNFSDVSSELVDEMNEELEKGDVEEAKAIAIDIKQNLQKINHHGKRADAIVKGMLQHSRSSSSTKEPTDINKLADEYLRLAYHGLRAKDNSFNAELITHFDTSLPNVNIIPQDVGRVMLNLFTNAFYATQQKSKRSQDYKPTLILTTSQKGNAIEITVKDNGTGIPEAIKDKILQPFFTTKPTGEGTGLGLSLSYDIIVKAHGGSISIDSTEGEGAQFIIQLPM